MCSGPSTGYWEIALREFPLHDCQDPLSYFLLFISLSCLLAGPAMLKRATGVIRCIMNALQAAQVVSAF